MNQQYRVVWNEAVGAWQAVCEICRSNGKSKSSRRVLRVASLMAAGSLLAATQVFAAGLPTGGNVVAGSGSISQAGTSMTINQSTAKMAVDWQSFSVGQGNTVNFVQPNASAVALNRVLGSDVSVIQGAINANGQVFLLNPNGVLFTPTAQVNVGSLVASTLKMSTSDFMAGNYSLAGDSANAVVNQGNITAVGDGTKGGTIALIAAKVTNDGNLTANSGSVQLAAASDVTLDLGGPVKLQVNKGALDALVQNGGAIQADGGLVYLTAQAVDTLTAATINNSGVIRAQTLATGEKGEIRLMGDMKTGAVNVGGTLDASAPNRGDGGFIETSAATVNVQQGVLVNASSVNGRGGEWLVDPTNIVIDSTAAAGYATSLNNGTHVTVSTASANNDAGDITVNSAISKTSGGEATLELIADRNIIVNQNIGSTSGKLNITLSAAHNSASNLGGVRIASGKILDSNGGNILIGGAGGNVSGAQASSNGIAYALNFDAVSPAVDIGVSSKILSGGGDIVINGYSTKPKTGGSNTSGVWAHAGTVIDSGYHPSAGASATYGGNIYISGISASSDVVFGVQIDQTTGNSGQTTVTTSTSSGNIVIDARSSHDANGDYALNMSNNGGAGNIEFDAYSVANLLFYLNGTLTNTTFTYRPPTSGCRTSFPNCGLMNVVGHSNANLYATYNAVNMATKAIYVFATESGSKVYDANTAATGLTLTGVTFSDPSGVSGFQTSNVSTVTFNTPSPNVGSYTALIPVQSTFTSSSGVKYAVSYNMAGSYSISPAPLTITANDINVAQNGTLPGLTFSASGLKGTDTVGSVTFTPSSVSTATLGTTTVTPSNAAGGTFKASNYTLTYVPGTVTVYDPTNITLFTITAGDLSKYYGTTLTLIPTLGSNYSYTATGGSYINAPLTVSLSATGNGLAATAPAGTYSILPTGQASGCSPSTCVFNYVNGTLTVNRAPLTVTASNASKTYGNAIVFIGNEFTSSGLVNGESIGAVTLSSPGAAANASVGNSPYVITPSGATGGTFDPANYAITYSNGSLVINKAVLGIDVLGTYNGTRTLTADGVNLLSLSNAVVETTGLVGNEKITSVTIANANVRGNGANSVISATGTDGFDIGNYQLGNSQIMGNGAAFAGVQTGAAAATNAVWLKPAPLGILVTGSYNGTATYTTASGATITPYGLVGQDANGGGAVTSATLNSSNPSTPNNYVRSVAGTGNFDPANYVLDGVFNAVTATAGLDLDGSGATNTASIQNMDLPPPPANPIIVPAFVDNGVQSLASEIRPTSFGGLNYVQASLTGSGVQNNATGLTLNFVSTPSVAGGNAAEQGSSSSAGGSANNVSAANAVAPVASERPTSGTSSLNFVSSNSQGTDSRKGTSELNVNNVTVPSASGPLDVYVIGTGINHTGITSMPAINN